MNYIYGLNKTGISIAKFLNKKKIKFDIWDDNITKRKYAEKIFKNYSLLKPTKKNLSKYNNIYVSPGISIRQKKFKCLKDNKVLKRDLNLYCKNISKETIIAITGTNGKSTTTKLVGDILKKSNLKTFIGGNIGRPLCYNFLSKKKFSYNVLELSSFQLETIKNFNTKISVLLNLSIDHMDRYKNMKDYILQKKNIFSKNIDGYNLISVDDKYSLKISKSKSIKNKITFSIFSSDADIYLKDNFINDNFFYKHKKIFIKKISKDLQGKFNLQNILVAYICTKILKISISNFNKITANFKGLPYRSKIIYEDKKITVINNSKATNLDSTIKSILNLKNVYLIIGGLAKEKDFSELTKFTKILKNTYLFGKSASFIHKQISKFITSKKFKTLNQVVDQISKDINLSEDKITILFAPGCSSFDQFNDYEQRGKYFSTLIRNKLLKK